MQQLYVLRRFSSWSFRLSAGVALLLSSVGLAAGLLASTTTAPVQRLPLAWKPVIASAQSASKLAAVRPAAIQILPVSLGSATPAYLLTVNAPALSLTSYRPVSPVASSAADSTSATNALKATVQRSWNTFKLAFR